MDNDKVIAMVSEAIGGRRVASVIVGESAVTVRFCLVSAKSCEAVDKMVVAAVGNDTVTANTIAQRRRHITKKEISESLVRLESAGVLKKHESTHAVNGTSVIKYSAVLPVTE